MTRARAYELRQMIIKASESLSDKDALTAIELFEAWKPDVTYEIDKRIRHDGKLFKVMQSHTSQEQYPPSIYTASLYAEVIDDEDMGTKDNPIPYNGNMALENGKYYTQDNVLYLCTRDTINPVYSSLASLVGLYVEIVEG
ncbi:MAG: hypothetical protein J5725_08695 [Bacteroidales bacterium]|nr:hypothetical protein [Bacteroidales bacterium]